MAGSPVKQPQYCLESIALFHGLPPQILSRIKSRCLCRRYEPDQPIVGHLDTSDEVHFLLTGDARVTIRALDGKAVMFRELAAGGMFGEHAAIDGRPRSATVEARTDCLVASIPAVAFREMLETELKVAKKLLEHFVSGIREVTRSLRIQHACCSLSHSSGGAALGRTRRRPGQDSEHRSRAHAC